MNRFAAPPGDRMSYLRAKSIRAVCCGNCNGVHVQLLDADGQLIAEAAPDAATAKLLIEQIERAIHCVETNHGAGHA